MKRCPKCETTKPLTDYHTHTVKGRVYPQGYCKICTAQDQKDRRAAGYKPAKQSAEYITRSSWLRMLKSRGLTEKDYLDLLAFQDEKCAICKTDTPWSRSKTWAVDHDHVTGKPRGLLCANCNNGLGRFKDSTENLKAAVLYLESNTYSQMTAAAFKAK